MDSSLQIIKIKNHLFGDYICKAANILGTAEIPITVFGKYYFYRHMHKVLCILVRIALVV